MEIDDQVAREIATFLNEKIAWDSGVNEWIAALTPEPDPHDTHDTCCPVNHTQVNPHCFWCQVIAKARADQDAKRKAQIAALRPHTFSSPRTLAESWLKRWAVLAVFDAS